VQLDALTIERVYKKAFTHEKAVEIIKSEKGRHFDPNYCYGVTFELTSFVINYFIKSTKAISH
jgi:HD-GYP domain-containing protein (c-di-GMP phosphodiesterase class II)